MQPYRKPAAKPSAIALDATYMVGEQLSGVGKYCREVGMGLAEAHPEQPFLFCYRPHRMLRSFREALQHNVHRRLLQPPFIPGGAALFHGMNQRLPNIRFRRSVCTFHDLFVLCAEYSNPEFRARFAEQARDAARRTDLIITVSEFTASQVEGLLGVERAKIRVVPHGVHPVTPGSEGRKACILHVGAIQKRKNVTRLVRAFTRFAAKHEGWRLLLAGSTGYGSEETFEAIESSAARGRIDILGYVSDETLGRLYREASILAFPSLDEGFGIPLLEAMAHGVAVITSNRPALREAAGDAALLVDPENDEAIEDALGRLAQNDDLRDNYVRLGYQRASTFTWQRAVEKTWAVYRELGG